MCSSDFSIDSWVHYTFVLDALIRKEIVQSLELGASVFEFGVAVLQSIKVSTGTTGDTTILKILVQRCITGKGLTLR